MLIDCPDCGGKLSTVAPRCPHCGYVQRSDAPPAQSTGSSGSGGTAAPEFIPPSKEMLKQAAKKQWRRWEEDNFWALAFGAIVILVVLGVLAVTVTYLLHRSR